MYTKGEWKVETRLFPATVWAVAKGRETEVATIHPQPNDQDVANAQLIASAPDLYEACKYLLDFLAMPTDEWVQKYGAGITQRQACDKARQAITKAESK